MPKSTFRIKSLSAPTSRVRLKPSIWTLLGLLLSIYFKTYQTVLSIGLSWSQRKQWVSETGALHQKAVSLIPFELPNLLTL